MKGRRTIVVVLAVAVLGIGSQASAFLIDDFISIQAPNTTLNIPNAFDTTDLPDPSRELSNEGSAAVGSVQGGVYSHSQGAAPIGRTKITYESFGTSDVTGYVSLLVDVVTADLAAQAITAALVDTNNISGFLVTDVTGPGIYAFSLADFLTSTASLDLTQIISIQIGVVGFEPGSLTIGSIELTEGVATGVPAPATLTLLGLGLIGLVGWGRRRARRTASARASPTTS